MRIPHTSWQEPSAFVDLCLSQIEVALLREELDRAQASSGHPELPPREHGIDSASFRLRGLRTSGSSRESVPPSGSVLDARRAACAIERLAEENRGLREIASVWRVFAIAAGAALALVVWNLLSKAGNS